MFFFICLFFCLVFQHFPFRDWECITANVCLLCIYDSCDRLPYCWFIWIAIHSNVNLAQRMLDTDFNDFYGISASQGICISFLLLLYQTLKWSHAKFTWWIVCIKQTYKMGLVGSSELYKCSNPPKRVHRFFTLFIMHLFVFSLILLIMHIQVILCFVGNMNSFQRIDT